MRGSHLVEAMWVALGAFIGFLPTSWSAINKAFFKDNPIPMSAGDFVQVLLWCGSFVAFVCIWLMVKDKKDGKDEKR